jgi:hypothetical protein
MLPKGAGWASASTPLVGTNRPDVLRAACGSLAVCVCASLPVSGQVRVTRPAARAATISAPVIKYRSDELQSVASAIVMRDGTCFAMDPTTSSISVFDGSGRYVKQLGRRGSGPGEFANPAAMAASPDGRLFVWDPGNNRVTVFAAELRAAPQTWGLQALANSGSSLMWFNHDGTVSFAINVRRSGAKPNPDLPGYGFPGAILRVSERGVAIDTTWLPTPAKSEYASAKGGRARRTYPIPFAVRTRAVWNPAGFLVRSVGNRYGLILSRKGAASKTIDVEDDAIPVGSEERRDWTASVSAFMRAVDPFWSWPADGIPSRKAPVVDLWSGADGRIWVRVPQAAQRIGSVAIPKTADRMVAFDNWKEPRAYDVFEPTGHHIGRLRFPDSVASTPVYARGDTVWLLSHDQNDVPVITKHVIHWRR